jgi:Leucine-rich repeat (LRR) protein
MALIGIQRVGTNSVGKVEIEMTVVVVVTPSLSHRHVVDVQSSCVCCHNRITYLEVASQHLPEQILRKVTDPDERPIITAIEKSGGEIYYDDIRTPGKFRSVKLVTFLSDAKADLDSVAKLKSVQSVGLTRNSVRDVSALASLPHLKRLELLSTRVSDIRPIAKMKSLTSLGLCGTKVHDLGPLANLDSLEALDLSNSQVRDIAPLA